MGNATAGRRWRAVSPALALRILSYTLTSVRLLIPLLAMLLSGCTVLKQLDEWSRPKIRYVDPRDIGPDGLPNAKRRGFVNKFIIYSEIPVKEFYGLPSYTSDN